jgi:hypothetical protein
MKENEIDAACSTPLRNEKYIHNCGQTISGKASLRKTSREFVDIVTCMSDYRRGLDW